MSYEPQEGIDYIVDLYAVTGVPRDVEVEELKRTLNTRTLEYHPDRLEGLAPEFQEKGERMARLLNRARSTLLDTDKRAEYDAILEEWPGPVSTSDVPVIRMDRYLQAEMANKSPEELELGFAEQRKGIEALTSYSPSRLGFLERMVDQADDQVPEDLRAEYEVALLEYDRILAIDEAERSEFLGINIQKRRYEASIDYAKTVGGEIEAARKNKEDEITALAIGSFSTRLALLASEESGGTTGIAISSSDSLEMPAYFDAIASSVRDIAEEREDVLRRRLENVQLTYPQPELQTEARERFITGIAAEAKTIWMGIDFDAETVSANTFEIPNAISSLLDVGDFTGVIQRGFNVFTIEDLEQVDRVTLINEAVEKHLKKFNLMEEDDSE